MRAPNCATGPKDNNHRNGNEEGRSMQESWRRMGAMWLGPLLFVAVSIFLWKYVGAVFMPELLARSVFQVVPGLASVELYVTINAALLYFGGYFVVDILALTETPPSQPVHRRLGIVARQCVDHPADSGTRDLGLSVATRLDCRLVPTVGFPLGFCSRSTVPGQAFMRLILAVFGIAVVLILAWAILWISASREKD